MKLKEIKLKGPLCNFCHTSSIVLPKCFCLSLIHYGKPVKYLTGWFSQEIASVTRPCVLSDPYFEKSEIKVFFKKKGQWKPPKSEPYHAVEKRHYRVQCKASSIVKADFIMVVALCWNLFYHV